ncbi:MAG TPA: hypothetical protein EYQ71_00855 [Candidatus Thioglobus sp.]|nr:hypothetical protein [Candidatus Thioglobus sp.]
MAIYPTIVIGLLFFIYFIPGIALFPKFILTPKTAATIPFISIAIVVSAQYILSILNQFNHQNVIIFIGILALVAIYRIYKIFLGLTQKVNDWVRRDFQAILLILFSSIPLMIILGFDGFQHADEIYSWNLWAKKIYFNQVVTFESTGHPYPLVLPSFIAFCYKFIGNIDYQLPIKFTFSLIYVSTIFTIYSFAKNQSKVGIFFITYIIVMLVIGVGYEYKKVYADTLMGGFLVSSLALLISLSKSQLDTKKNIPSISILLASVILISAAALTKQGAMLWTMIFYPLLAYVIINKNTNLINSIKWILLVPIFTPVLWYFIGGEGFQNNAGVIRRSMGERGYVEQLLYGFNESFINNPILLLFMSIVFIVLLKNANFEKIIIAIGISLSTVLLLLFGAYETTRLYLHVILMGWLIIFAYGDDATSNKIGYTISKIGNSFYTYTVVGLLFIVVSIFSLNKKMIATELVTNLLDGREVQANWVVGKSGAEQYRSIVRSKMGLWAPNSHVWGIYYGMDGFYRGRAISNSNINYIINYYKEREHHPQ